MANKKLSGSAITGANTDKANDCIPILDVSVAAASQNKTILLNELRAALFCGASAKKSSDQTGANFTTEAGLLWNTNLFDTDNWHSTISNTSRFTVPSGLGITKVLITGNVVLQNCNNASYIYLKKNGAAAFDGAAATGVPVTVTTNEMSVSNIISCTAGDYFELFIVVVADTSVDVLAAQSNFSIMAVG